MNHKVLILTQQQVENLEEYSHPNAEIHVDFILDTFNHLEETPKYDLIILSFDAFYQSRNDLKGIENRFNKLLMEFFNSGGTLCLIHYNEPNPDLTFGIRFLKNFGIESSRSKEPAVDINIERNEFNSILSKWGASHYTFRRSLDAPPFEGICNVSNPKEIMGFSFRFKRGRVLCLPFQHSPTNIRIATINSLVDSVLSYLSNSDVKFPKWADESFFEEEIAITRSIDEHNNELKKLDEKIKVYNQVKPLMLLRNYELEDFVVKFFQEYLCLRINRIERFVEDFWIQNENGDNIIIGEIKSFTKGFKKTGIYSICSHREENDLEENFPALLIVNQNLQAGSWAGKEQPILKKDYELAYKENVLICRTEDLIRLWYMLKEGKFTNADILKLFLESKGWLEVNKLLEIVLHPKK